MYRTYWGLISVADHHAIAIRISVAARQDMSARISVADQHAIAAFISVAARAWQDMSAGISLADQHVIAARMSNKCGRLVG